MTEFFVEYNPYKNETIFKVNNEDVSYTKFKIIQANKYRMQSWLEKLEGWDGLVNEICEAVEDNEINIVFKGRKIDFEDLEYYVNDYKGDKKLTLSYTEAKNDNDILDEIQEIVSELKNSPIEELNGDNFQQTYDKVKNSRFPISVIATMSSGKSTIINSLLGTDLLPARNEACTATVARITDNNDLTVFTAECRDKDGKIIIEKKEATPEDIENYNDNPNVMYIDIEGSIPEIDSSSMRLVLQDTPGPNNSRNQKHGAVTNSIINSDNNSVVMYIMNATQFAIDDDRNLLYDISEAMKKQGKQSRDRFIFVLNKCDRLDPDKGETVEKLLQTVSKYLNDEFGISDPNLFPVSALTAKIIRKYLKGEELTRSEKRELDVDLFLEEEKCHFEKYATLSPSCRKLVEEKLEEAKKIPDAEESEYRQVLIHTGIPAIEAAINEYLKKYAYPIKIEEAVKDFVTIIDERNMKAKFDQKIVEDNNELEKIRVQLADAYEKHEEGRKASEEFKDKINDLELDDRIIRNEKMEIESALDNLTRKYIGTHEVEKEEAEKVVTMFNAEVSGFQYEYSEKLKRTIDRKLVAKGEEMLSEYKSYVDNILVDIEIGDFNFYKVEEFDKNNFKSVYDLINKNVKKEELFEDIEFTNYNRAWYEIWKPKTITVRKSAGVRQTVDVSQLVQDEMPEISNIIKNNIEKIFDDAKEEAERFKIEFARSIDQLNGVVDKLLEEINEKVSDTEKLKQELINNENKIKWISNIKSRIDEIMNF